MKIPQNCDEDQYLPVDNDLQLYKSENWCPLHFIVFIIM